jgi:hypothetical protein
MLELEHLVQILTRTLKWKVFTSQSRLGYALEGNHLLSPAQTSVLFSPLGAQGRVAQCEYCGNLIPNAHKNTRFCRNNKEWTNAH